MSLSTTVPVSSAEPVSPDDANDLAQLARGFILDGAATIKLTLAAGKIVTLQLPAGRHDIPVKRIWSTSLTAGVHVTVLF